MTRYHTNKDGHRPFTAEEETQADKNDAASAAAEKEYIAKEKYKDDRRAAYPAIGDQLDDIYHNGIDKWKETIKAVKDKYPKP